MRQTLGCLSFYALRITFYVLSFAPISFLPDMQVDPPLGGTETAMVGFSHA